MAKQLNARIITKHDRQSNWERAETFVPKLGEIIVYDADHINNTDRSVPRLKIGDGLSNINVLRFITEPYVLKDGNKVLSTHDYVDEDKAKVVAIPPNPKYTDTLYYAGSNIGLTADNRFYSTGIVELLLMSDGMSLQVGTRTGNNANDINRQTMTFDIFSSTAQVNALRNFINQQLNQQILTGTQQGTININGTDVAVNGLSPFAFMDAEEIIDTLDLLTSSTTEILISETFASAVINDNTKIVITPDLLFYRVNDTTFNTLSIGGLGGDIVEINEDGRGGLVWIGENEPPSENYVLWFMTNGSEDEEEPAPLTFVNNVNGLTGAVTLTVNGVPFDNTGNLDLEPSISVTDVTFTNGTTAGPIINLVQGDNSTLSKALPVASASQSGVVTTGSQTWNGNKTTNGIIVSQNGANTAAIGYDANYGLAYLRASNGTNTAFASLSPAGDLTATRVFGAVWNDYAEYRRADANIQPGRVIQECANGVMSLTTERLAAGAKIVSDTFGFAIGETPVCSTPIAVCGRVLAYTYEDRGTFRLGEAVCAAPNGTISRMTREEIQQYPERIIGTVSEIPQYNVWGTDNIKINGRIWIYVR